MTLQFRSRRTILPPCPWALSVLAAIGAAIVLGSPPSFAQDNGDGPAAGEEREALYHCYLDGLLTDEDARRFKQDIEKNVRKHHSDPALGYIVIEIESDGTPDGDPAVAIDIADTIADLKGITTVAYVRRAANGAVLIAMACKHLVIHEGGSLGHSDSNTAIPKEKRERAEAAIETYHHKRKRDYPVDLPRALIGADHDELFLVPKKIPDGRNDEVILEVLTRTRLDEMNAQEKVKYKPGAKDQIARKNEVLHVTATEALKYELSKKTVTDFEDVLVKLRFDVAKEDRFDQKLGDHPEKPRSPDSQALIDFLNHHIVRFVLLVVGALCLMLEFKMPGTFIPGAISLGCFLIFFLAGFFPVTGVPEAATNVFELILFFVGIALIAAEIFLAPGVMFFGLLGITVVMISIVMAMVAPSAPLSAEDAFFNLIFSLAVASGLFLLLVRVLPKTSARSGLVTRAVIKGLPTYDNVLESQEQTAALVGLRGRTITPLRPSGKIDTDGRILDVVAEGEFIETGDEVEIIEATAFRAVVRRV